MSLMKLPDGKTCRDCRSFARCQWLLAREGDEADCDFYPVRFTDSLLARTEPEVPPAEGSGSP